MLRKVLLVCGIVAAAIYVGSDIVAALRWEGYDYAAQSVSELRAVGAPTRAFLLPILAGYAILELAFGIGVWLSAGHRRSLRVTGALLVALGVLDSFGSLFSLDLGQEADALVNTIHLVVTLVTVVGLVLVIIFGSGADGRWFRVYSFVTLLLVLGGGTLTFLQVPRIQAGLPTPSMGVTERINIYGYMVWLAVLAIVLLRQGTPAGDGRAHRPDAPPVTRA